MRRRPLLAALTATALAVVVHPSSARPTQLSQSFEKQLTFDDGYAEGEPSIAVNPRDPKNIIVTFLANVGYGFYGAEHGHPPTNARDHEQAMQGCDELVTFDGGKTWKQQQIPLASYGADPTRPNCSDTLVLFDQKGVAYIVGSNFQFPTFAVGQGDFRLIRSYDGGRTWTQPTVVSPAALSPGDDPAADQGARFFDDREFMALDASNGYLYVNGTQGRATAGAQGNIEYLAASHDGGKTWLDAVAVGTASAVQLAAAHGTVLFASPIPAGESRECTTCTDVVISTDGGKTVGRYPTSIPDRKPYAVADPRRPGHFAIAASDGVDGVLIYRSDNGGHTWNKSALLRAPGRAASKLWLDWSPEGVLGIGWRAALPNGDYGFWGAVSFDDGKTFSSRRISTKDSPKNTGVWVAGDDTSAIWLTHDRFYATWGDWRSGNLQTYWGGFTFHR